MFSIYSDPFDPDNDAAGGRSAEAFRLCRACVAPLSEAAGGGRGAMRKCAFNQFYASSQAGLRFVVRWCRKFFRAIQRLRLSGDFTAVALNPALRVTLSCSLPSSLCPALLTKG